MIGRIVEVAGEGRYLHAFRGFLEINERREVIGRVPLDDIAALIVSAHGVTYSNQLLVTLSQRGVPTVLCGKQFSPQAVIWPCESHHLQGARLDAQLAASLPSKKRLWQQIVRAKLSGQAAVLGFFGLPSAPLSALVSKVRSGDAGNYEGVGARRYWPLLLGSGFRRDRGAGSTNALLNYGYTVLRATVARHLIATGLCPAIGLAHSNAGNAFRLVDDLIEPFRPFVDARVKVMVDGGLKEVSPGAKEALARLMVAPIRYESGLGPMTNAIERACMSLVQVFLGQQTSLSLPEASAENIELIFGLGGDERAQEEEG